LWWVFENGNLRRNTHFSSEEKLLNGFGRFFCREFLGIGRFELSLFVFFTPESFESSWSRIGLITFGFIHYKLKELEEYEKKVALIE
jgi:hypothetical protein